MKKTGIELIAAERREQIEKHGRTTDQDEVVNNLFQLSNAASALCKHELTILDTHPVPTRWSRTIWTRMMNKTYKERLIIAGALIAAEIDRLQANDHE